MQGFNLQNGLANEARVKFCSRILRGQLISPIVQFFHDNATDEASRTAWLLPITKCRALVFVSLVSVSAAGWPKSGFVVVFKPRRERG